MVEKFMLSLRERNTYERVAGGIFHSLSERAGFGRLHWLILTDNIMRIGTGGREIAKI